MALGDIMEIQLGKMLSPAARLGSSPRPYLRNANVQWNRFDLTDVAEMDFSPDEREKFLLRAGDLLVCEGGEPGRAAVWNGQIAECYYQKALHRLRPRSNDVDPNFVMYRLWHAANQREFTARHGKTTIAHLPADRLGSLRTILPSLEEQNRIATEVGKRLQAVKRIRVAAVEQLIGTTELFSALIRDSLQHAGPLRPLDELLCEVREGVGDAWRQLRLVGATRGGIAPAKERVGKNPHRYKPVVPGSVFYNPMRILLGSIAMLDDGDEPAITSPDYVVLRAIPGHLNSRWFYYWFRSEYGAALIRSLTRGAVRERLLFRRLAKGQVSFPSLTVQERTAQALQTARIMHGQALRQVAFIDSLPAVILSDAFRE